MDWLNEIAEEQFQQILGYLNFNEIKNLRTALAVRFKINAETLDKTVYHENRHYIAVDLSPCWRYGNIEYYIYNKKKNTIYTWGVLLHRKGHIHWIFSPVYDVSDVKHKTSIAISLFPTLDPVHLDGAVLYSPYSKNNGHLYNSADATNYIFKPKSPEYHAYSSMILQFFAHDSRSSDIRFSNYYKCYYFTNKSYYENMGNMRYKELMDPEARTLREMF